MRRGRSHTPSQSLSPSHTLSLPLILSVSLSISHTPIPSLSLSPTLSLTLSHVSKACVWWSRMAPPVPPFDPDPGTDPILCATRTSRVPFPIHPGPSPPARAVGAEENPPDQPREFLLSRLRSTQARRAHFGRRHFARRTHLRRTRRRARARLDVGQDERRKDTNETDVASRRT